MSGGQSGANQVEEFSNKQRTDFAFWRFATRDELAEAIGSLVEIVVGAVERVRYFFWAGSSAPEATSSSLLANRSGSAGLRSMTASNSLAGG